MSWKNEYRREWTTLTGAFGPTPELPERKMTVSQENTARLGAFRYGYTDLRTFDAVLRAKEWTWYDILDEISP